MITRIEFHNNESFYYNYPGDLSYDVSLDKSIYVNLGIYLNVYTKINTFTNWYLFVQQGKFEILYVIEET